MITIKNQFFKAKYNDDTCTLESLEIIKPRDDGVLDLNKFKHMSDVRIIGDKAPVVDYKSSNQIDKLILPKGVREVRDMAFFKLYAKSVVWPDECVGIPDQAFMNSNIEKLLNIAHVTSIGKSAFKGCTLKSCCIPDGVAEIPETCFCLAGLSDISGGKNVKKLGSRAFYGCLELKSFTIPTGVDSLPSECFSQCIHLREVNGLDHIKNFGRYSFYSCSDFDGAHSLDAALSIGKFAFCYSSIESIDLRRSICGYIGRCAFADSKIKNFMPGYFQCTVDDSAFDNTPLRKGVKI